MPKAKRNPEEERALLLDNEASFDRSERFSYPIYETAIAKGVANHVGKWPSHLFAAFLAASLVFAAFILFAMVTALFCAPDVAYRCRRWKNVEFPEYPNVYFVKHTNRSWSTRELCYVESAARDNPEINVYLINLLGEPRKGKHVLASETEKFEIANEREMIKMLWENANNSVENLVDLPTKITTDAKIRKRLAAHYANVRNVDVTVDDFFKGSMLAHACHNLDIKTIEVAAKAYVLWNTPGVALDPYDSRYLGGLRLYLCKEGCKTVREAAVNPEGSIQASGIPCQAFVGCLIHEIAIRGSSEDWKIVKQAQQSFCPRANECPGLKILTEDSSYFDHSASCPIIYPSRSQPKTAKIFSAKASKLIVESTTKKEQNTRRLR